jgi:hypothetical protein
MKSITVVLPDALREALGHVIANERREWRRERELMEAQARETIAELRAKIVEIESSVKQTVEARLASVKDGDKGDPGPPGESGKDGQSLSAEELSALVVSVVGKQLGEGEIMLADTFEAIVRTKVLLDS